MKRALIVGLSVSGESTMLRGIGKLSDVRADLEKHNTDPRFSKVFLCEPTRCYRVSGRRAAPAQAAVAQAVAEPAAPVEPKPGKFRK